MEYPGAFIKGFLVGRALRMYQGGRAVPPKARTIRRVPGGSEYDKQAFLSGLAAGMARTIAAESLGGAYPPLLYPLVDPIGTGIDTPPEGGWRGHIAHKPSFAVGFLVGRRLKYTRNGGEGPGTDTVDAGQGTDTVDAGHYSGNWAETYHQVSFLSGLAAGMADAKFGVPVYVLDFYHWAAQGGGPPELTSASAYSAYVAQIAGLLENSGGKLLVAVEPQYAYGDMSVFANVSGSAKNIFLHTPDAPVQASGNAVTVIPAVSGGHISLPYYREHYANNYYYYGWFDVADAGGFSLYFQGTVPAAFSHAACRVLENPTFTGAYYVYDTGNVNSTYVRTASCSVSNGVVTASCDGIRAYYRGANRRPFHSAEFDFTNPLIELTNAVFSGTRPHAAVVDGSPLDEQQMTLTLPGSGPVTFEAWLYDYAARTYTLTLPNDGGKLRVAFEDAQILVTNPDGTTETVEYTDLGASQ